MIIVGICIMTNFKDGIKNLKELAEAWDLMKASLKNTEEEKMKQKAYHLLI